MHRLYQTEILERESVPDQAVERAYRELTGIHRYLGDTASLMAGVRRDPLPVRRILDVGCARGGVLEILRHKLGVDVVGVDLNPPNKLPASFPIIRADAVRDPLPGADLAFSMYLAHHLSEFDLIALIRNVGKSCRRFILLDVVRHPLPLALFSLFIAPWVSPIVVADGRVSIRRAYTASELKRIASEALAGTGAVFRHSVAPCYVRQVLDISYAGLYPIPTTPGRSQERRESVPQGPLSATG